MTERETEPRAPGVDARIEDQRNESGLLLASLPGHEYLAFLMIAGSVVLVRTDSATASALAPLLEAERLEVRRSATVEEALRAVNDAPADFVILDMDASEPAELAESVAAFEEIPVVVIASGGAREAVVAMRAGAADFVQKPCDAEAFAYAVRKVRASQAATADRPPEAASPAFGLLGDSKAMHHVLDVLRRIAPGNATCLIRGESGTGKELVARALHAESPRSGGPFVKVHCAGLPEALLESELFGYEKGAFTGASARKPGRVEIAEGGTLFLDEIGDISAAMQVKLLRLLQDREYERLGGIATLRADVRFVAATHRDLEHMIKKGEFREDLFYRLNVVPIWLPPLRARREDVALLATRFCDSFATVHGKEGRVLSEAAVAALKAERWPGNVRQLQNFVERLVVLSEGGVIDAEEVRRELSPTVVFSTQGGTLGGAAAALTSHGQGPPSSVVPLDAALREAERAAIDRALRHAKGNRTLAARLLGVSRATFYTKLEEHGLTKRHD